MIKKPDMQTINTSPVEVGGKDADKVEGEQKKMDTSVVMDITDPKKEVSNHYSYTGQIKMYDVNYSSLSSYIYSSLLDNLQTYKKDSINILSSDKRLANFKLEDIKNGESPYATLIDSFISSASIVEMKGGDSQKFINDNIQKDLSSVMEYLSPRYGHYNLSSLGLNDLRKMVEIDYITGGDSCIFQKYAQEKEKDLLETLRESYYIAYDTLFRNIRRFRDIIVSTGERDIEYYHDSITNTEGKEIYTVNDGLSKSFGDKNIVKHVLRALRDKYVIEDNKNKELRMKRKQFLQLYNAYMVYTVLRDKMFSEYNNLREYRNTTSEDLVNRIIDEKMARHKELKSRESAYQKIISDSRLMNGDELMRKYEENKLADNDLKFILDAISENPETRIIVSKIRESNLVILRKLMLKVVRRKVVSASVKLAVSRNPEMSISEICSKMKKILK